MADRDVLMAIMGQDEYSALTSKPKDEEYYNLQLVTRALNSIKPIKNKDAKVILYQADNALDKAIARVRTWTPGQTASEEIVNKSVAETRGHLDWHRQRIGKDPGVIYEHGDDLKKWAIDSFVEYNAAIQGNITEGDRNFFRDVAQSFAELLQKGKSLVGSGTSYLAWGLGLSAVGLIGYGWYQLKMAKIKHSSKKEL